MLTENTPLTLQLKLQDCLIEVTRFDDDETKSALFSLNCYLTPGSSIHQGATFDCHMVSYSMFENDVRAHFNYNPDRDEIRWDNKSSFQLKSKDAGSAAKVFIVKSHNSWVTALLAMQSAHGQQASTESSSGAIPLEVSARFSIMRADYDSANDPDYSDSARSDHSTTSGEEGDHENCDGEDSQSEIHERVKDDSDY